jgi:hypothetical protein
MHNLSLAQTDIACLSVGLRILSNIIHVFFGSDRHKQCMLRSIFTTPKPKFKYYTFFEHDISRINMS